MLILLKQLNLVILLVYILDSLKSIDFDLVNYYFDFYIDSLYIYIYIYIQYFYFLIFYSNFSFSKTFHYFSSILTTAHSLLIGKRAFILFFSYYDFIKDDFIKDDFIKDDQNAFVAIFNDQFDSFKRTDYLLSFILEKYISSPDHFFNNSFILFNNSFILFNLDISNERQRIFYT